MNKNQALIPEKIGFTHRIQTRLIMGLLLLAVLPLAFLGPYAYRQAHDGYEDQVGQNMQGIAHLVKSQIVDTLATGDQQVGTWTRQADARIAPTVFGDGNNIFALLQNRFRNFLKSQREVVPIFSEILCVKPAANDASGNVSAALVLYSTDESHERKAIFDGFWEKQDGKFQVASRFLWQTGEGATRPLPSPFGGNGRIIPIVRSYQDTNGETVALIGLVNLDQVQRLIANTAIGDTLLSDLVKKKDTYALLTEKDGTIITGLFPAPMAPQNSVAPLLKQLSDAKHGRAEVKAVGDAFLGRSDFGHGSWQVLSVRSSELAMAPIDSLRKTMVAAIILLLGVIIAFSLKIAKRITDPVQDLVQATQIAAEGDLSRTIEVKSSDEIGVLAKCFNHMTLQLKNSFKVLEQQNEELKRLDRLKSEFLANTSHELRTPMNGIIGLLDATLAGAFGSINETAMSRLKLALASANRLKTLVNDMLNFSANQSSGEDALLNIEEMDLCVLIRDQIIPQFEGMNLSKGLEFKLEFEKDMPKIHADREKLRQVFTNLLGNAFKFTAKGSITIRAKTLKNEKDENDYILCEIRDTGIGIPTHLLAKIFDVFFQVDGGADRKYEGTGLGLAIAKQIVEQHGGKIWAESVLGQGATFFIKQPIHAGGENRKPVRPVNADVGVGDSMAPNDYVEPLDVTDNCSTLTPEARKGEGETILVVDDEPVNVEVLRAQLEFHNYKVVGMHSGHAAIDYLKTCDQLPALVLLDIMMPEMSGYDFCRHLKESPALKNIPVVMVSAKNQMVDRIYGLNLGALDYIVKPFEKVELLAKIRVYLDLQKLHRDLEKLNADLENKVKERTMELEVAKARAESLAMHDTLTGLPNRNLFQDRLGNTFARSRRSENQYFAVAFVDLDNFKVVNDSLGHEVGDKLLIAFGERVRGCLREVDTVARFGGDEFTLILAGMENASDASHIINRIHDSLKEPFVIEDRTIHATASIGVALNNPGYNSPEDLLRDADTAMYQAKARGKARHEIFSKDMHFIATERFKLEAELRSAIKFSEFCLYYQPIVSFETGVIVGFEALVRWNHRERGIIGPQDFLNLAEETGLIVPIGRWVVGEACQQIRIWEDLGLQSSPTISVNVSAKQFKDNSLVEDILGAMKAHEIDGEKLKLEITESALIVDLKKTTDLLLRISNQKLGLLLDDFGTGYSSLSYLYRLPFQGIKIDRSFVESMLVDEKQANIIRATVGIGKSLGLTVTAEGVETIEQIAFLREAGCHFAQGYYFSRPVAAEDATKLLINEPAWIKNWDQIMTLKPRSEVNLWRTGTENS